MATVAFHLWTLKFQGISYMFISLYGWMVIHHKVLEALPMLQQEHSLSIKSLGRLGKCLMTGSLPTFF